MKPEEREMLKELGMNEQDLANLVGIQVGSVLNQCSPKKNRPTWLRTMLHVYKALKK
jgi:hypothetical protein